MSQRAIRRAALVSVALAIGCGPNYRYAYDGEAAFERCYALDYDGAVTPGDRSACWSAWLQTYAYGANPDRLDYARNRLTASSTPGAQNTPLSPTAPPTAAPAASAPIVANTPPAAPTTAPESSGMPRTAPPPTSVPPTPAGEPPGSSCANECRSSWGTCGGRCAQRDAACEARCDDVYRDCMRGCY